MRQVRGAGAILHYAGELDRESDSRCRSPLEIHQRRETSMLLIVNSL